MKKQTKRQKEIQVGRELKKIVKADLEPQMLNYLSHLLNKDNIPDEWMQQDNECIKESVLKKFIKL